MSSICDKAYQKKNLRHFVVDTRIFQIEKTRNLQMYGNLQSYIKKQNEKRKQEMEMSEELKRNKREMEMKRRKDKLTLEEINNETTKHEEKLNELRNEKHQLFAKFKKVLTDDENRKNLQRQKDAAYVNVTFGSPSVSKPPPPPPMQLPIVSSAPILMGNTNNPPAPIPVPLHTPYFAQMQTTNVSSNSSTSVPTSFNHHRMNGRVPTPTSSTFAVPKTQPSQSIYSKPMPHHSSALTSIPPTIPTSSPIVPSSIQNPYLIQNDRHRLSYKRTLEQTSSPVTSIVSGVNTAHLPYLPNYKPGMHPPPPGSFPQLPNQHVMQQPTLEQLQNIPFYQSLMNYNLNPFLNNPNAK